jgi:predicted Co/Zn/Cd cation transporter (cation efflux family)
LKAGIILGILYGIFSLIIVPFLVLAMLISAKTGNAAPAFMSLGFAVVLPIMYAFLGFIGGVIMAALYNLIACWTGGFEFEVKDVAPVG